MALLSWGRLKGLYVSSIRFLGALRSFVAGKMREYASALLSLFRIHGSALLSFFGAILAVVSLVATTYSALLLWKLLEAVGVALAAIGAFISSIQQSKASDELFKKNDLLIELQRKVSDRLTGGTDYCYLTVTPDFDHLQSGREYLSIFPPMHNPLYDVRIQYSDTAIALTYGVKEAEGLYKLVKGGGSFNAVGTAKYDQAYKFDIIQPIGFFKWRQLSITHLPFVVNARFDARNGRWHQSMMFVAGTDGKIASADFVVRMLPRPHPRVSDCEVLRKRVSKDFPDQERIFVRVQDGKEIASDIPFCCLPRTA
jgi:hypothetical protein